MSLGVTRSRELEILIQGSLNEQRHSQGQENIYYLLLFFFKAFQLLSKDQAAQFTSSTALLVINFTVTVVRSSTKQSLHYPI